MENKSVSPAIKKDEMLKEITELEAYIAAAKSEVYIIENEEKLESHKKNFLEVRKNDLQKCLEFYRNKAEAMRRLLSIKLVKHSKYSMAATCYDKLLNEYAQNYLQNLPPVADFNKIKPDILVNNWGSERQIEEFKKEIDELQSKINDNIKRTKMLMENLQYQPCQQSNSFG